MKSGLITGAAGFVGRNLREALVRREDVKLHTFQRGDSAAQLEQHLQEADVVFHLAGVNRPPSEAEFATVNAGLTEQICEMLRRSGRTPKIVFASSTQAACDNAYGRSKLQAEATLERYAADTGAAVSIYRLTNIFGKWCRPNYNSVVATFCHNIANDLPIQISDTAKGLELVYIDDVVGAFTAELADDGGGTNRRQVPVTHRVTLGQLAEQIRAFQASRSSLVMPDLSNAFAKKLYATFLSYLPEDGFSYPLAMKSDQRGELAEFIKSSQFGQIFVSRTRPGVHRGHHFHHTKAEKFLVLDGEATIRFRHIERSEVIEYPVSGKELRVVDIPPGYTHSLENTGSRELIVLFWASEIFNPQQADTFYEKVA